MYACARLVDDLKPLGFAYGLFVRQLNVHDLGKTGPMMTPAEEVFNSDIGPFDG